MIQQSITNFFNFFVGKHCQLFHLNFFTFTGSFYLLLLALGVQLVLKFHDRNSIYKLPGRPVGPAAPCIPGSPEFE